MELKDNVQAMVDEYVAAVEGVEAFDAQLGNVTATGRAVLNTTVKENTPWVSEAQTWAQKITLEEDSLKKVVLAQTFIREIDPICRAIVKDFIDANSPDPSTITLTDEQRAEIAAKRSEAQKLAKQLFGILDMDMILGKEAFQALDLPACPEGIKGSFGKRGSTGRRLEPAYYTVNGEEVGVMKTADLAKRLDIKTSDINLAVEAKYPESTPDNWRIELGKHTIVATKPSNTEEDFEDDESSDDDTFD